MTIALSTTVRIGTRGSALALVQAHLVADALRAAGVDLAEPSTVRAVVDQLDSLVARLESLI